MARNINGGTDRISYRLPSAAGGLQTVALRVKTTQAAAVQLLGYWSSSSRNGLGLILEANGKVTVLGYAASANRLNIISTSAVNNGSWHTVVVNANGANGGANAIFIDGTQEATANSSGTWGATTNTDVVLGDSLDSFWVSYIGDYADVGFWNGVNLTAEEIAAYHKGFSAVNFKRDNLELYAPIVRDTRCLMGNAIPSQVGTTVTDHPMVIGSLV